MSEEQHPVVFDRLYGLELLESSPDRMRAQVAVRPEIMQPFGIIHGGIFCAIGETLASIGTYLGVRDAGNISIGQSNHTNFLRPVSEGTIHAEATPRHRGRTSWIWDVEMRNDDGALCAIGRLTIAVRPQPQQPPASR